MIDRVADYWRRANQLAACQILTSLSYTHLNSRLSHHSIRSGYMSVETSTRKIPDPHLPFFNLSHLPPSPHVSLVLPRQAPALDSFALGIHDIELYRAAADNVSSKILQICAQRLEERDYYNTRASPDIEMGREDSEGSSKGKSKVRIRPEKRQDDIGLVLGALSRIERR